LNRALITWVFVFIAIATGLIIWVVTQPIVHVIAEMSVNMSRSTGTNSTTVERGISIISYINVIWIGIYIIAMLIFGFLSSTHKEGVSSYARY